MPEPLIPLAALANALANGETTALKLAEAHLARAMDPSGEGARAFIALDADKVKAQARASDELRRHGIVASPLAGLTVSVKDLLDVMGEVSASGSKALADSPPATRDAPVIARLRAAGAVLFGRTNMVEFAYAGVGMNPHHGTPRAPFDRKTGRIPGGSSSGAAVAVADGLCAISLGTDTGGSCRIPAAFCGVVGYKPTQSVVPILGAVPLSHSLDSIGSLGASVACVSLLHQIMAGEEPEALPDLPLKGQRLGVIRALTFDGVEAPVAQAFERAVSLLSSAGAVVQEIDVTAFKRIDALLEKGGLTAAECYASQRELIARKGNVYDPRVRSRIELGATQTAAEYQGLLATRRKLIAEYDAETAGFDAMIAPTTPILPPPIAAFATDAEYMRLNRLTLRNTAPGNFADICAISLPCHRPEDPPVGFMLMGARGNDRGLLTLAAAVERGLARPLGRRG